LKTHHPPRRRPAQAPPPDPTPGSQSYGRKNKAFAPARSPGCKAGLQRGSCDGPESGAPSDDVPGPAIRQRRQFSVGSGGTGSSASSTSVRTKGQAWLATGNSDGLGKPPQPLCQRCKPTTITRNFEAGAAGWGFRRRGPKPTPSSLPDDASTFITGNLKGKPGRIKAPGQLPGSSWV